MAGDQIVDRAALARMSSEEVVAALGEGRLSALLGGADIRRGRQLTAAQWGVVVRNMSADEVLAATEAGLLKPLDELAGVPSEGQDVDQGARGRQFATERERLRSMTPDQIAADLASGRLDKLLGGDAR